MPGITINDLAGIEEQPQETMQPNPGIQEPQPQQPGQSLFELFKRPTAEGSIEEYQDHVLNFDKSKGVARIIRGLTGLFGELNFAIADLVIGGLDVMNRKKRGE